MDNIAFHGGSLTDESLAGNVHTMLRWKTEIDRCWLMELITTWKQTADCDRSVFNAFFPLLIFWILWCYLTQALVKIMNHLQILSGRASKGVCTSFTLLHQAWSCSGCLPGSVSTVTVAVPIKLGWISAGVIWKSPVSTTKKKASDGSFLMLSLPFLSHAETPFDLVTHRQGARCLHEAWGCRKPTHLEWSKREVEAEFNLQENRSGR